MPHWMEAMVNDVPEHELHELKMILWYLHIIYDYICFHRYTAVINFNILLLCLNCSKILDPDMSPLGFDAKKMYNFVAKRFINTSPKVQEQALNWLQTLTMLEIMIPLCQLFSMFSDGVAVMGKMNTTESEEKPNKAMKNIEGDNTICK